MGNNRKKIELGHKKMITMIDLQIGDLCRKLAIECLRGAVSAWDADKSAGDLTGNLRTSFGAAVYRNKRIMAIYSVFNIGFGIEKPTSTMTTPGDSGFVDYSSGEFIGSENDPFVKEYNKDSGYAFVDTTLGQYGYNMTSSALNSYSPKTDEWTVVVASVTPYGEYLFNVRKLDILDSQSSGQQVAYNLSAALANIKDLDAYKVAKEK